ncbi:hypothetical protein AALB_3074 [Agarivorans albus MKT 106]|uniref:Uncharacterized protein n=1 Tax=Agarivorans albus MKT 106 TaxID=1331007 RepID=R9PNR5_AGAAL|nr:hypothetical protein AALB_3074 [Agarivorans albus MKT 106]
MDSARQHFYAKLFERELSLAAALAQAKAESLALFVLA